MKEAITAAIEAGLTPKEFVRVCELAADSLTEKSRASKIQHLNAKQSFEARRQAAKLIDAELSRAADRELELRWEVIRGACMILEQGPVMWTAEEPLF